MPEGCLRIYLQKWINFVVVVVVVVGIEYPAGW
jgi:hypothetical protein